MFLDLFVPVIQSVTTTFCEAIKTRFPSVHSKILIMFLMLETFPLDHVMNKYLTGYHFNIKFESRM